MTTDNTPLDEALQRALPQPGVPAGFRARLNAAVARSVVDAPAQHRQAEAELELRLAELKAGYVSLRRRTLGSLIGVAFVTGIGFALAWPWFIAQLGDWAPLALPMAGVAVGLVTSASVWLGRATVPRVPALFR
jgi:hypothetical protein